MDHVVYLDAKAEELANLLSGLKTRIVRGAAGRKLPYGRVSPGDVLYFVENDGSGVSGSRAVVNEVINSDKLSPEASAALLEKYQDSLQLTSAQFKRWAGKRYLVLIAVSHVEPLPAFRIDRRAYGNMDDWLPVGDINIVRVGAGGQEAP